jgi:translation initiation factor 2B subunit (eIF-2B alpha/beta/delta family)
MNDASFSRLIQKRIKSIRLDNRSGAVQLTRRAALTLRLLSLRASKIPPSQFKREVFRTSISLIRAQPTMASMFNLANSVLRDLEAGSTPNELGKRLRKSCDEYIRKINESSLLIARRACGMIRKGSMVATHSFSSTVFQTLLTAHRSGKRICVICTESQPLREGVVLARELRKHDLPVTVVDDAAVFSRLLHASCVMVGADAVTLKGVVNKMGTFAIALVARCFGVPLYVLCDSSKFLPSLKNLNPTGRRTFFDLTPFVYVSRVISEDGVWNTKGLLRRLRTIRIHRSLIEFLDFPSPVA